MAKSIIQDLIEAYKELEKDFKEVEKDLEKKKVNLQKELQVTSTKKPAKNGPNRRPANYRASRKASTPSGQSKVPRQRLGEGESQTTDYMERAKTLRDKESNLENKRTLIGSRGNSPSIDNEKVDIQASDRPLIEKEGKPLISEDLSKGKSPMISTNPKSSEELKVLVRSLKSGDRLVNARRAFIYSNIFDRRS